MELLCEPLCEWCTYTSKLEEITQTLLLASVCVINKIVFEDLDLHGYFAWFFELYTISLCYFFSYFHQASPPPPSLPLFSWVWAGSPCSRWIHCKTEGLRVFKKRETERGKTATNKTVFVSRSLWFCVCPCAPVKAWIQLTLKHKCCEPQSLTPPICEY